MRAAGPRERKFLAAGAAGLAAFCGLLFLSGDEAEPRVEIAGSYTAEIVYERGGKRHQASVEINKRPPG